MNMKLIPILACALAVLGCDSIKREIKRTSESPSVISLRERVALGHQDCSDSVEEVCNPGGDVCENVCDNNGSCYNDCHYEWPSCHKEVVTNCEFIHTHDALVNVDLRFDERATLSTGQEEKITLTGKFDSKTRLATVKLDVQSRFYEYTFPKSFQFRPEEVALGAPSTQPVNVIDLVMKKKKK